MTHVGPIKLRNSSGEAFVATHILLHKCFRWESQQKVNTTVDNFGYFQTQHVIGKKTRDEELTGHSQWQLAESEDTSDRKHHQWLVSFYFLAEWMMALIRNFRGKMEGNKYAYNFVYLIKKIPLKIGRIWCNTSRKTNLQRERELRPFIWPDQLICIRNAWQTHGYIHLKACNFWLCGGGGLCILYFHHIPAPSASSRHFLCSTFQEGCRGHAGSQVLFVMWHWPKEIMGSTVCLNHSNHTHVCVTVATHSSSCANVLMCTWATHELILRYTGVHLTAHEQSFEDNSEQVTQVTHTQKKNICNLFATHTTVFSWCPDGDRQQDENRVTLVASRWFVKINWNAFIALLG